MKFDYCRVENRGLPCPRIMDCWFERIDINGFITSNYTEEERNAVFSKPADRLSTIFDIIKNVSPDNNADNPDR